MRDKDTNALSFDSAIIDINEEKVEPKISSGGSIIANQGEEIELDASKTSLPLNGTYTIWWDFGDGSIGYGSVVFHTFSGYGIYEIIVHLSDNDTDSDDDYTSSIKVYINARPIPKILIENKQQGTYIFLSDTKLNFESKSRDPDDVELNIIWDFGDGTPTVEGESVTHKYKKGEYFLTLTVSDGDVTSVKKVKIIVDEKGSDDISLISKDAASKELFSGKVATLDNLIVIGLVISLIGLTVTRILRKREE